MRARACFHASCGKDQPTVKLIPPPALCTSTYVAPASFIFISWQRSPLKTAWVWASTKPGVHEGAEGGGGGVSRVRGPLAGQRLIAHRRTQGRLGGRTCAGGGAKNERDRERRGGLPGSTALPSQSTSLATTPPPAFSPSTSASISGVGRMWAMRPSSSTRMAWSARVLTCTVENHKLRHDKEGAHACAGKCGPVSVCAPTHTRSSGRRNCPTCTHLGSTSTGPWCLTSSISGPCLPSGLFPTTTTVACRNSRRCRGEGAGWRGRGGGGEHWHLAQLQCPPPALSKL